MPARIDLDDPVYHLPPDVHGEVVATPLAESLDWPEQFLGLPELWKETRGLIKGKPQLVAVLDTGCDVHHPELEGVIEDAADFTGSMWGYDDHNGHGTWTASKLAAKMGNDQGGAGVVDCRVLVAKVLGDSGAGTDRAIMNGMAWAYKRGARFFSLSLGGPKMSERLRSLFSEITQEAGRFVFCAAGNDGGSINVPARWNIAVGACDEKGELTPFSCRGPELAIIAPGTNMVGALPGGRYGQMSGTSMACPLACGVGMLAYAKHETIGSDSDLKTQSQMIEHLRRTAVKKGQFGLLNPKELFAEHKPKPSPRLPIDPTEPPMVVSVTHGDKIWAGTLDRMR